MLRNLQRIARFQITRFEAAVQKWQQTKDTEWGKNLPKQTLQDLELLYSHATQGYRKQTPYTPVSKEDKEQAQFWSQHMGFSKQKAEDDYVTLVQQILDKQKENVYVKSTDLSHDY